MKWVSHAEACSCLYRYYQLDIEFFMSTLGANLVGVLTEKFLWMKTLGSTPMLASETHERCSERITGVSEKLESCEVQLAHGAGRIGGYLLPEQRSKEDSALSKAMQSR
jgi:COP9 signalosome complex subunit 5